MRGLWVFASVAMLVAVAALALSVVALVGDSDSADADEPAQTQHLSPMLFTVDVVDQAVRRYQAYGWADTAEHYLSPDSVENGWSVFMISPQNRIIAAQDRGLLGKGIGALGRDNLGVLWGDLDIPERGRWVRQQAMHPVTGTSAVKHTWVVRHDGFVFGSAWYE